MSHSVPTPRTSRWQPVLATLLAVPLLLPVASPAAHSASFDGMLDFGGYHVGAFVSSNGARVYCLEPGAEAPVSAQRAPTRVSTLPAYTVAIDDAWGWRGTVRTSAASGEKLRQMNWILAEHGNTADPVNAVAVQIALWEIRREPGNAAWLDGKYALFSQHGGKAHVEAGKKLATEARVAALGPGHARPDGTLQIMTEHDTGGGHGGGTVSYPAGTTELVIEGGLFAGGTSQVHLTGGGAGTLAWTAAPHEPAWQRSSTVTVTGTWSVREKYWPAELILHPATREVEQRIGAGVAPVTGTNSGAFGPVHARFETDFRPAITTQVPDAVVLRDESMFRDTVTVSDTGSPWPTRGEGAEYLPLLASGTLYGPFHTPQPESDHAPEDAPVAGVLTLPIQQGPGDYEATLAVPHVQAGYYYWLWEILEEAQPEEVRASGILETGARHADRFGVSAERQLVPTDLRWETNLVHRRVTPNSRVLEDRVRAFPVGGAWLRDDAGERIPATLRLTYYLTPEQPAQQPNIPENARELGTVKLDVDEEDRWVQAPGYEVPRTARGWVTVQTCLVAADQPEPHSASISEWCDDFGVPSETAEIVEELQLAPTGNAAPAPQRGNTPSVLLAAGLLGTGTLLAGIMVLRRKTRGLWPVSE